MSIRCRRCRHRLCGAVGSLWTDIPGNGRLVGTAQKGHAKEGDRNTQATEVHVLTY